MLTIRVLDHETRATLARLLDAVRHPRPTGRKGCATWSCFSGRPG